MVMEPESVSEASLTAVSVAVEVTELEPEVTVAFSAVSLVAAIAEVTASAPLEPAVCDRSERVEEPFEATTLAVTPRPAVARVELTVIVPSLPLVPELSARLDDPSLLVTIEAVKPRLVSVLMAAASPESVLTPLPV
jgi:hypothetical protein